MAGVPPPPYEHLIEYENVAKRIRELEIQLAETVGRLQATEVALTDAQCIIREMLRLEPTR